MNNQELDVYDLLISGLSYHRIAYELGETIDVVKHRIQSIYKKHKVNSQRELMALQLAQMQSYQDTLLDYAVGMLIGTGYSREAARQKLLFLVAIERG